jgi:hypothetical protein
MRICILGYDGLEYSLVEKLNLRNIMQKEFGKVIVPIEGGIDDPSTPIVWTSFITGETPEVHGVDMPEMWHNSLDGTRRWIRKYKLIYKIIKRLNLVKTIRSNLGVKAEFPNRSDIKCDTIFDKVSSSISIDVPVYDVNLRDLYPLGTVYKARQDPEYKKEYLAELRNTFQIKQEKLFSALEEDWNLLMIHFMITDLYAHVQWGSAEINVLYREMDFLTKKVKKSLRNDDLLLIISDHGMSKLGHTKYGFYSLNIPLNLNSPRIEDFAQIILTLLNDSD